VLRRSGEPGGDRTLRLLVKSQMLYL